MLGYLALLRDRDPDRALQLLEEAAAIAEEAGFRWWLAGVCSDIALISLDVGRAGAAAPGRSVRSSSRRAYAIAEASSSASLCSPRSLLKREGRSARGCSGAPPRASSSGRR